jgi:hypothetical protein
LCAAKTPPHFAQPCARSSSGLLAALLLRRQLAHIRPQCQSRTMRSWKLSVRASESCILVLTVHARCLLRIRQRVRELARARVCPHPASLRAHTRTTRSHAPARAEDCAWGGIKYDCWNASHTPPAVRRAKRKIVFCTQATRRSVGRQPVTRPSRWRRRTRR